MNIALIKRMMDACYQAKRVRDLLPALPDGVLPSFIQYLDAIQTLEQQGVQVKVSDLSDALSLPRPGVTRTVKDMEARGLLTKQTSPEDGRVIYLTIRGRAGAFPQIRCGIFQLSCSGAGGHPGRGCGDHDPHHRDFLSDHGRKERFP